MTALGVAWSTHFRSRGLTTYGRLQWAYRPCGLFAAGVVRAGGGAPRVMVCDESFAAVDFDGTCDRLGDGLDLLYVAAHGELRHDGFRLVTYQDEWHPTVAGLEAANGPRVAVFDACNLVDLSDPGWSAPWLATPRPRLRLLCGFASNATMGKGPAERGRDFADLVLSGEPVAGAWLRAVVANSSWLQRDIAVAIGFGVDQADAEAALDAPLATLLTSPALTSPGVAVVRKARR